MRRWPTITSRLQVVKVDMDELKESVKQLLANHQGRGKAIKGAEIALLLGQKDDRFIRLCIRDLIADGCPVASSVQKPYGYFLVENRAEADKYRQTLKNRLIEDALRLRDFKRGAGCKLNVVKQGVLI